MRNGVREWYPRYLKRKVSRLRDWNLRQSQLELDVERAWKEKYLDYEIETLYQHSWHSSLNSLEKKSISITRLKQDLDLGELLMKITWKEKYLDYEIETNFGKNTHQTENTWKEKYLDYEIETKKITPFLFGQILLKRKVSRLRDWNQIYRPRRVQWCAPWKEKYLDYEIETG